MEKVKCKECGKEISKKAEICPNCGCRVKSNLLKLIIVDILVIVIIVCGYFAFIKAKDALKNNQQKSIKNQYVGTWVIETQKDIFLGEMRLFIDDVLSFTEDRVLRCFGCTRYCEPDVEGNKITKICDDAKPTVHLGQREDEIAIDFVDEYGYSSLLCFRLENENTLKQISCKGIAVDEANPEGFALNGGIEEEYGIVYKKK